MKKFNLVGILVLILIISMSVGFALYKSDLGINSNISLKRNGKLEITSASIVESESSNLSEYTNPSIDGLDISFNITGSSDTYEAVYLVDIVNNSFYDYDYTNFSFSSTTSDNVVITSKVIDLSTNLEINPGEVIKSGSTKNLKVILSVSNAVAYEEISISGKGEATTDKSGSIIASITPSTGNLQGSNKIACFTVNVANTYTYDRNFTLSSSNENISLVDSSLNILNTFKIAANSTNNYEVCTKVADGSTFMSTTTNTVITLNSTGISSVNVGEITLEVEDSTNLSDYDIPVVGNVVLSILDDNAEGEATVSFDRIDTGGTSIVNYYITLYNSDTGESINYETGSSLTTLKLSNISEGNYYVTVYGVDEAGNTGASSCESASEENGYCSKSSTVNLKWNLTVTFSLSNLKHDDSTSSTDTVLINNSYSTTLSLNTTSSWYSLPSSVTITMGGNTLTSGTDYTYSSGKITINKVTSDVTITASANYSCLIKGTKVTLASGKKKNIEDITYNDLLLVWNYETGTYTYEYPIWIEKEKKVLKYQKTTFTDGSILNTYGKHGLFSTNLNKFVSVNDPKNFHIGTTVAKLNNKNKIVTTTVKNIEVIEEVTYYYHVVSTTFYNIIANDFITTDGTVILSNIYKFNNNIKWLNYNRNDLYTYSDFKDIMPYYMYKGLRVEEGKRLNKYLNLNEFKYYLLNNQLNDDMLLKPLTDSKGNRLWKVTTSDDYLYNNKLYKEDSYYILKQPKNKINFKYWYNTADRKKYKPNDRVKVLYGTHFVAIYK